MIKGKCLAVLLLLPLALALPAALAAGDTDYILKDGRQVPIPLTYTVRGVTDVFGEMGVLKTPQDVFIDAADNIYIADTGNNRVLKLDKTGSCLAAFDNGGKMKGPEGVYVDAYGDIFVADTGNQQILHLDPAGAYIETFVKPDSVLLDDTMDFAVRKIAVSAQGDIYAIKGKSLMKLDPHNEFKGFIGSNQVESSFTDRLVRLFASDEQKAKLAKKEAPSYSNFLIAPDGMLYGVTSKATGQIKKINTVGQNVYPENFYGESVMDAKGVVTTPEFVDLAVDARGIVTALDQKSGKLYQYDQEGNLLTVFGGKGNLKGQFSLPVSVAVNSEGALFVLDASAGELHAFEPTSFIQDIGEAVKCYADGDYDAAYAKWQEVFRTDVHYPLANKGIGQALYKSGRPEEAMRYFEAADDKDGYTIAYEEWRYAAFRQYFLPVLLITAMLAVGVFLLWRVLGKRAKRVLKNYYGGGEKR